MNYFPENFDFRLIFSLYYREGKHVNSIIEFLYHGEGNRFSVFAFHII